MAAELLVVTLLSAALWLEALTTKAVLAMTALARAAPLIAMLSWGGRCAVGGRAVGSTALARTALARTALARTALRLRGRHC